MTKNLERICAIIKCDNEEFEEIINKRENITVNNNFGGFWIFSNDIVIAKYDYNGNLFDAITAR